MKAVITIIASDSVFGTAYSKCACCRFVTRRRIVIATAPEKGGQCECNFFPVLVEHSAFEIAVTRIWGVVWLVLFDVVEYIEVLFIVCFPVATGIFCLYGWKQTIINASILIAYGRWVMFRIYLSCSFGACFAKTLVFFTRYWNDLVRVIWVFTAKQGIKITGGGGIG